VSKHGRRLSDGGDRKPQYLVDEARRRKARLFAVVCAFVAALLPAFFLIVGLHVDLTAILLVAALQFMIGWGINNRVLAWAVARSFLDDDTGRAPRLPRYRGLIAVPVALLIACLTPLCLFDREIEATRGAFEQWPAREQALHDEDGRLQVVVARPLPSLAANPELVSLQNQLDQAKADLPRIRKEAVCEGDGTCGSGLVGEKERYNAKVKQADDLQKAIDEHLPHAMAGRKKAMQDDIDTAGGVKAAAERRRDEIETELRRPPQWSDGWDGRLWALDDLAIPSWMALVALLAAFLAGVLYYVVDVVLLRTVARRICTSGDRARTSDVDAPGVGVGSDVAAQEHIRNPEASSDGSAAVYRTPMYRLRMCSEYLRRLLGKGE
jgi:Domain of unknown function (DUF4407)